MLAATVTLDAGLMEDVMTLRDSVSRLSACVASGASSNCQPQVIDGLLIVGLAVVIAFVVWGWRHGTTIVLTLRSRALAPALARRLSRWVRTRDYTGDRFFAADGAGPGLVATRKAGLDQLAATCRAGRRQSLAWSAGVREGFSDLRFTDANRVPFPFARMMREHFDLASVVTASDGPRLRDLDGNWSLDVSGSYGLNVAGFDRYKDWIAAGWDRVKDLGPVLGPLHPVVAENIALLKSLSGLDEVSFHMSGTEAVMAAARLARFNTGRRLIVCFAGAYHGWWDGVVAGLGSERRIDDCLTLRDLDPRSLAVIRRRARNIAAVLVNPVQSFHPNAPPPNDAILLTSSARQMQESTERYAAWLKEVRRVCTECDVPLIFDEVYTGFRLAAGGGQEYFGVQADIVVYGKTVAGGLPIGVVCGRKDLMRRFDSERPMRLAYVVGTFSAHPAVMGAMNEFLRWATQSEVEALYADTNARCAAWARSTNVQLAGAALPLRVVHLGTIWTVLFTEPGRYNWLLQYYLRAKGITMSWVGTGRCLASMDFSAGDYQMLQNAIVGAAREMRRDGWWLTADNHPRREQRMKVRLIAEMLGSLVPVPASLKGFYSEVMRRKEDDHHASHSDKANQLLHLVSSSVFIYCYVAIFSDLTIAMCLGLASLFVRQFGHAVLEPLCHDKEETLLGYNTRNKTIIVLGYLLIPAVSITRADVWSFEAFNQGLQLVAQQWFAWTVAVVAGRVAYLIWKFDVRTSMIWYVKLVTDPFTDVITYFPRRPQSA
jgi:glutamate-1-semialdehyde 2,1-aminomutase